MNGGWLKLYACGAAHGIWFVEMAEKNSQP